MAAFDIVWSYAYEHAGAPRPEPVFVDGTVIATAGQDLVRLDLETGEEIWRRRASEPQALARTGIATDGRHLLVAHVDDYRGFRVSDGEMIWQQTFDTGKDVGKPKMFVPFSAADGIFYVPASRRAYAFNADDFSTRFRSPELFGKTNWVLPAGAYLLVGQGEPPSNGGQLQSYLTALDATTGDTLWTRYEGDGHFKAPGLLRQGIAYVSNTMADFAIEVATGEVVWRAPAGTDPDTGADLATAYTDMELAGSTLYGYYGYAAYARDAETGRRLWLTKFDGMGGQETVYHDGYLYVVHATGLYVLRGETGEIVHQEHAPSGYWWNVTKGGGRIVAQSTSHIVAFDPYGR